MHGALLFGLSSFNLLIIIIVFSSSKIVNGGYNSVVIVHSWVLLH